MDTKATSKSLSGSQNTCQKGLWTPTLVIKAKTDTRKSFTKSLNHYPSHKFTKELITGVSCMISAKIPKGTQKEPNGTMQSTFGNPKGTHG